MSATLRLRYDVTDMQREHRLRRLRFVTWLMALMQGVGFVLSDEVSSCVIFAVAFAFWGVWALELTAQIRMMHVADEDEVYRKT